MLADLQQKGPSIKDIFAGIGYIFGLLGVAAYVQSRKRNQFSSHGCSSEPWDDIYLAPDRAKR
jgi:hypothetical protein